MMGEDKNNTRKKHSKRQHFLNNAKVQQLHIYVTWIVKIGSVYNTEKQFIMIRWNDKIDIYLHLYR